MKKYLFLLIYFITIFNSVKSTDWFPNGAKWYWSHEEACCAPPLYNSPFRWHVDRDTLIQNKLCKIIERNGFYNAKYILYSENNVITRFINNKFLPTYDFNKATGDTTLIVSDSGTNSCDTFFFVIDSIKPLQQDNQFRVQYGKLISNTNCSFTQHINKPISIIEKIGLPDIFNTYRFFATDIGAEYIRCYEDSSINLSFVNYPCDATIIASVTERINNNLQVKIFPNPSSDEIQIEYLDFSVYKKSSILLIDLQGKILKKIDSLNNSQKRYIIDISTVLNGTYLLKIMLDEEFTTKSIIINH